MNEIAIVVSDHGAGPAVGELTIVVPANMRLSGAHGHKGFLIADDKAIQHLQSLGYIE